MRPPLLLQTAAQQCITWNAVSVVSAAALELNPQGRAAIAAAVAAVELAAHEKRVAAGRGTAAGTSGGAGLGGRTAQGGPALTTPATTTAAATQNKQPPPRWAAPAGPGAEAAWHAPLGHAAAAGPASAPAVGARLLEEAIRAAALAAAAQLAPVFAKRLAGAGGTSDLRDAPMTFMPPRNAAAPLDLVRSSLERLAWL